ncbi:YaaC family protein [Bradyrhizobium japonicum]|uniref:YaaC family protein n=1 Tax=Bradyrhizobium japonicum TaxID=375 RepID=UPI001BA80AA9|nr:hypothetical protein [Bradyrhizobium japonicum]MBR0961751.1 hypothetical protein [Bradyrhizobium japonicum]
MDIVSLHRPCGLPDNFHCDDATLNFVFARRHISTPMIIRKVQKVKTADMATFAWAGLRRFQNVDLVADRLIDIHLVPKKHHSDVRKQAQQIRYCLIQAREYFSAAKVVTPATKPNLLYYGTMSLALAEILFKQSGLSSLDKARVENKHHGLTMTTTSALRNGSLKAASGALRARPHESFGTRKGTFELWHRSSREHPVSGIVKRHLESGGSTKGYEIVLGAIDSPFPPLPTEGITLAECLEALPLFAEHLGQTDLRPKFVRGSCESEIWLGPMWHSNVDVTFHPSDWRDQLLDAVRVDPGSIDRIHVREAGTGLAVRLMNDWIYGHIGFPLPPASVLNTSEWRMWINAPSLNEFGYLYVALFLAGNYARYFPDRWLLDVETSTALALAIEELCAIAEWRAPWLAMCELGETLYVVDA